MTQEVTLAEVIRRVDSLERRQTGFEDRFVLMAIYTRDLNELRNSNMRMEQGMEKIEAAQTWAMRLIAAQFVALIIALLLFVVQRVPT